MTKKTLLAVAITFIVVVGSTYAHADEIDAAIKEIKVNEINDLAKKYINGDGVVQNDRTAFNLYMKAARMGSARAQNELGNMYGRGDGVERNCEESHRWFNLAAKQKYAKATCNLAADYINGHCAPMNPVKALQLQKQCVAETNGDAEMMRYLGGVYMNGFNDSKNAFKWTLKSANKGDVQSQALIGMLYYEGNGVPKDVKKAKIWFSKAAAQGDQNSIKALRSFRFD